MKGARRIDLHVDQTPYHFKTIYMEKENEKAKPQSGKKFSLEPAKGTELIAKNMSAFINDVVREAGEDILGGASPDRFEEAFVQARSNGRNDE